MGMEFDCTEVITSRKNPFLLKMASLQEKKYRETEKLFLVEGKKLTEEVFLSGLFPEFLLFAESKYATLAPKFASLCESLNLSFPRVFCFSDACFEKISTEKSPEGVIAVLKHLDFFEKCIKIYGRQDFEAAECADERMLVLYDLRDPSNLGAIMRSALAFGIDRILFGGSCVDLYNPKTVRASMGALFHLKFAFLSDFSLFADLLREKGRRLLAAELTERAKPLGELAVSYRDVFVIGNEGHGIPFEISALCNESAYIPISENSESLNASVAASILLWEQARN